MTDAETMAEWAHQEFHASQECMREMLELVGETDWPPETKREVEGRFRVVLDKFARVRREWPRIVAKRENIKEALDVLAEGLALLEEVSPSVREKRVLN